MWNMGWLYVPKVQSFRDKLPPSTWSRYIKLVFTPGTPLFFVGSELCFYFVYTVAYFFSCLDSFSFFFSLMDRYWRD